MHQKKKREREEEKKKSHAKRTELNSFLPCSYTTTMPRAIFLFRCIKSTLYGNIIRQMLYLKRYIYLFLRVGTFLQIVKHNKSRTFPPNNLWTAFSLFLLVNYTLNGQRVCASLTNPYVLVIASHSKAIGINMELVPALLL